MVVSPGTLVEAAFVRTFVGGGGRLTLRATGLSCTGTSLWLLPPGGLHLLDAGSRPGENCSYQVRDLASLSDSRLSAVSRRLSEAFLGGGARVTFVWRPPPGDPSVCPSSAAKYLHDAGASEVSRLVPEETLARWRGVSVSDLMTDDLDDDDDDEVKEAENAAGACAMGMAPGDVLVREYDLIHLFEKSMFPGLEIVSSFNQRC